MTTKTVITKSRKWHSPEILAYANNEEIGLSIKLDDYLQALVAEIGNPTFIVTQAQLLAKLRAASVVIEQEMHDKSVTVI